MSEAPLDIGTVVGIGAPQTREPRIVVMVTFAPVTQVRDEGRGASLSANPRPRILTLIETPIVEHGPDRECEAVILDRREKRAVADEIGLQIWNVTLWWWLVDWLLAINDDDVVGPNVDPTVDPRRSPLALRRKPWSSVSFASPREPSG